MAIRSGIPGLSVTINHVKSLSTRHDQGANGVEFDPVCNTGDSIASNQVTKHVVIALNETYEIKCKWENITPIIETDTRYAWCEVGITLVVALPNGTHSSFRPSDVRRWKAKEDDDSYFSHADPTFTVSSLHDFESIEVDIYRVLRKTDPPTGKFYDFGRTLDRFLDSRDKPFAKFIFKCQTACMSIFQSA
jgi:hypothetical protein